MSYDQYNLAKAQQFIYDSSTNKAVLIGSSLCLCFNDNNLTPNISNISFVGLSSLTGLEVVKRSGKIPQFVIVEINFIQRSVNYEFIDKLYMPAIWKLRKYFQVFRAEWQPVSVLIAYIEEYIKSKSSNLLEKDSQPQVNNELLRINSEAYQDGKINVSRVANLLRQYIQYFEKKGTTFIFLEMPVHPLIYSNEKTIYFSNVLEKEFPASKYHWIKFGASEEKETSDGLHLNAAGVKKYAPIFNNQIKNIVDNNLIKR